MPEDLIVPSAIEEVVQRFDRSDEPFAELQVHGEVGKVRQALQAPSEAENLGAWSEMLAFGLTESRTGYSPWNTYFAPLGSATQDGKIIYFPDVVGTPAIVLSHWADRARALKHPVLKARYADLVWEMTPIISKTRRDPEWARAAIDAYLASALTQFRPEIYPRFDAVLRALSLACLLNDNARIDDARNALMVLHRESVAGREGSWWRAFDRLIQDKKARVSDDERKELVADLEKLVENFSDPAPGNFDPHATESAAQRLIKHYSRLGQPSEVTRLHTTVGRAFEHFASISDAMLASAVLQTSMEAYKNAGLVDDSKRIRILMQEKIGQSKDQMASIGTEITIKKDDVEQFLKSIVVDDPGATFVRIAVEFLPKRSELENAVRKTLEEAPLMAHITQKIMADDHVAAVVGSVEDDPFGRLFQQAKFTFGFSHVWLREALRRTIEVHNALPEHFVGWANRHGLYDDMGLLLQGVRAWYDEDYVKAVHVLIPQIEHAIRSITG